MSEPSPLGHLAVANAERASRQYAHDLLSTRPRDELR